MVRGYSTFGFGIGSSPFSDNDDRYRYIITEKNRNPNGPNNHTVKELKPKVVFSLGPLSEPKFISLIQTTSF